VNESLSSIPTQPKAKIPKGLSEQPVSRNGSLSQNEQLTELSVKRSTQAFSTPITPTRKHTLQHLNKLNSVKRSESTVPGFLGASIPRTPHFEKESPSLVDSQSFVSSNENRSTKRNLFPRSFVPSVNSFSSHPITEPNAKNL
jgi:hypothetical protein